MKAIAFKIYGPNNISYMTINLGGLDSIYVEGTVLRIKYNIAPSHYDIYLSTPEHALDLYNILSEKMLELS